MPESPVLRRNNQNGSNLDSLFGASAYQQLGQRQGGQQGARQLYVCVGCNTPLFTSKDLIDHEQNLLTASSSGRFTQKQPCQCFFVKQREWMPGYASENNATKGPLECYRKVCKRKLGQFNKDGIRCNCGKTVKPAFQINKTKVKQVGQNMTHVNLGQSGSSSHNLHSSSDLGKYGLAVQSN